MKGLQRIWFGIYTSLPLVFFGYYFHLYSNGKYQPWFGLSLGVAINYTYKLGLKYFDSMEHK